jgi:hypothetical protein
MKGSAHSPERDEVEMRATVHMREDDIGKRSAGSRSIGYGQRKKREKLKRSSAFLLLMPPSAAAAAAEQMP